MEKEKSMEPNEVYVENLTLLNKKKSRFLIVRIIAVAVTFIVFGIYLLSPLSTVSILKLDGNIYFTINDIYNILNCDENDSIYKLDSEHCKDLLDEHPLIGQSNMELNPFKFNISIRERTPVASFINEIYAIDGKVIDSSIVDSEYLKFYFDQALPNIGEFLIDPSTSITTYFSQYLEIGMRINKENNSIKYFLPLSQEKNFVFYYKVDSISNLLRVSLNYDSHFTILDYVDALSIDGNTAKSIIEESNGSLTTDEMLNDKCYSLYANLIESNGKLVINWSCL